MPNRPRRPLEGWDPYGEERSDQPKRRIWSRYIRLSLTGIVALLAFGHDLLRIFEPISPTARTAIALPDTEPVVTADAQTVTLNIRPAKTISLDPRTRLPRGAKVTESPATWFTPADYPNTALQENLTGRVKIKFRVDPDGFVRTCDPVVSSGSPVLDQTTCGIFEQRARYWPARDAQGHAVSQSLVQGVRWVLPNS